jgi:hypothetical protein
MSILRSSGIERGSRMFKAGAPLGFSTSDHIGLCLGDETQKITEPPPVVFRVYDRRGQSHIDEVEDRICTRV